MNTRITHIDNAKGIGIILIVASHVVIETDKCSPLETSIYNQWDNIISSFYIPLFFLLSGIFESSSNNWGNYWKRIRRIVKYIIVFWIWGCFTFYAIYSNWGVNYTPTWFLYVLLYITLIWGIVKKRKTLVSISSVIIMGGIGFCLAYTKHSYFYIGQSLLCLPFYAIGYWQKEWLKDTEFRPRIVSICFITWLLPTLLFDDPQNISINWVGRDILSFYIAALSGSILIIELSKLTKWNILSWIGRNSLIIMMVHLLFKHINIKFLFIHIDSWWVWILFVLLWTVLSCCFVPLFRNRYYKLI